MAADPALAEDARYSLSQGLPALVTTTGSTSRDDAGHGLSRVMTGGIVCGCRIATGSTACARSQLSDGMYPPWRDDNPCTASAPNTERRALLADKADVTPACTTSGCTVGLRPLAGLLGLIQLSEGRRGLRQSEPELLILPAADVTNGEKRPSELALLLEALFVEAS